MSLNAAPSSDRVHIGIFGRRNAGKSSIINAITGQNLAIVSDIKGTTTDPVLKAMELLPLGPVVIIDTPGLDDTGELGELRIQKAYQILNKTDIAVLVIDSVSGMTDVDAGILDRILKKEIPYVVVLNKSDLAPGSNTDFTGCMPAVPSDKVIAVSTVTGENIHELKELIARQAPVENERRIVYGMIKPSDFVVLVVPIDKSAPKGRLILPQQQTIRDVLESGAVSIVTRETELEETMEKLGHPPALVITDSQAFEKVAAMVPLDIPLTSFSILFARYKGNLETVVNGAKALDTLEEGDTILISEGCTHHRQCEDIGTVKLPRWITSHTGKKINYEFSSGTEFPIDLSKYKLIIHCGGCTLNEREMKYRLKCAQDQNIPITNYGIAIAHMKGILERSIEIFKGV
ncbi:[FeFe] hydrogenase H-cluster maturation GTPase HydF [Eubacterium sp. am_0171]|uniref:[FeFe] hydrogenase H-cluster maturation GTPase HydF n=1 Tax=unclassified Eubacterium (in: firmicutes) TaxID=2624479 RepID=UPI001021BF37|nr:MULTISPECIES: [FeFe] hydrogenase H-cluster maturation GTPase HydF [unclassified Eubacterium (in: firmicutes)]MDU7708348.1 [FeFe] hydrogenase H-cluster maturation GTPase HydF [Clostridium sp.]MSC83890.1 [FeFe] hydrogenase H-cluster maturation GTPase HydF [Eubacterium sp. BIOML-A1]MSD07382.1 [FeFe] hydrogenase H-cluster maturation GTPase HydF [Eubacterium sp. BIOML-A2]RYT15208.1 [FeFe] hydrogenase H-cluster maturation GTPase HydF [Eubacterium sp. am_0171]